MRRRVLRSSIAGASTKSWRVRCWGEGGRDDVEVEGEVGGGEEAFEGCGGSKPRSTGV